jgi:hypothetical protein
MQDIIPNNLIKIKKQQRSILTSNPHKEHNIPIG